MARRSRSPLRHSEALYENVLVLNNDDGRIMFRTSYQRAAWYLKRCLASIVSEDPFTIRLAFQANGPGHANDPYFVQEFRNVCVVCGGVEVLSHHHIVPYGYRRYFPEESRKAGRWMYDVLLLCVPCHRRYERAAHELKIEIAREYGVPIDGFSSLSREDCAVMRAAVTLGRYGEKIPEAKRRHLEEPLVRRFGRSDFSRHELGEIFRSIRSSISTTPPGEAIVPKIRDIDDFSERWRRHFVRIMQPAHLPEGWTVERRIYSEPDSAAVESY